MKPKFKYTGIRVKALDESVEFYTKLFGMKLLGRSKIESSNGEVASLVSEDGGPELELNYYENGSKFATEYLVGEGLDHLAFQVDDLNSFAEEAKRAGHPVVLEMKGPTSRWAYIQDPNGIHVEIFA
ncbi:MAG: VOC family protein [Nitrososphaerales archaeon]